MSKADTDPRGRRVLLGHVAGAHGIRGEVLIKSYTGDPAAIGGYGPLSDEAGVRELRLEVVRVTTRGVAARVAGVGDRNAAEALKGLKLYVRREQLPEPEPGAFYHSDLIGLAAVTADGLAVGEVSGVENFGAGDLIEIRRAESGRTELIPFNDDFVPKVDLAAGTVVVVLPSYVEGEDGPHGACPRQDG